LKSVLRNFRSIVVNDGGSQIAEAAFVLPLLFMILLGIMSFGRAFNVYSTITRAAQDGAAIAATSKCSGICTSTSVTEDLAVAAAVRSALRASRVEPSQLAAYAIPSEPSACPGLLPGGCGYDSTGKIRICRNVQLNPSTTTPAQCGAIVSFQYPYHFQIPFASINLTDIQMTAVGERQMEN
jgi:Flp pilus assembly protein TadG